MKNEYICNNKNVIGLYDMTRSGNNEWNYQISIGDKVAFKEMFEFYYAGLCVYATRFIEDVLVCEDIVQDVFCSVWLNRKNLDPALSIKSYLLTSVRNHSFNYLQRKKKSLRIAEAEILHITEDTEEAILLNELERKLAEALSKLPTEYRIAFEMSRMENKPVEEIALNLGVSTRTVERYRNRATEILRKELKDYIPLLLILLHIKI
jgi:RNA polymerase sigma-70 factor (ECF subfamily)